MKQIQDFEIYLKEIGGFKEAIQRREKEIREENEKISAKEMVKAARAVESNAAATAGTAGGVAQIIKPRPPPLWTRQKFDRWKAEVIRWRNHVKFDSYWQETFIMIHDCIKGI